MRLIQQTKMNTMNNFDKICFAHIEDRSAVLSFQKLIQNQGQRMQSQEKTYKTIFVFVEKKIKMIYD
ncbi:unnamed protein product [Paramecium sonneborni]|uniref:Uncharacterized protein n=1 Tax=Paramecium sonneborni TaxID=65129 RepID=A0A8S1RS72_9CILI|nr:unnamed protein product [Paramecium sonneborni]